MDATGLVFSAIAVREGTELSELIATVDYLNRTVLYTEEFEGAIGNLLGRGLIEEFEPLRFRPTEAGIALWARTEGDGGVIKRMIRLSSLIPDGPSVEWSVDRQAFESAEASYRQRMDKFMGRDP